MGINIGIDLGTTFSVCCFKSEKITFIKDEAGSFLIPSVVCYGDEKYIGFEALENEENYPQSTIRSSKRFIGKNIESLLEHKKIGPIDVATDVLFYIKSLIKQSVNEEVDGLVITVPAYFNQNQRLDTKKAAELAGFNVLRIINEPTAAAIAYGEQTKINELVLVYDLGGGTFDVTLLQLSDNNVYQVLSTSGDTKLGGDDFDQVIMDLFIKSLPGNIKQFKDFKVRLKKFAEECKIQLNYKNKIKKTLKYIGTIDNKIYHHEFTITVDQYIDLINNFLLKTKSHVLSALTEADKKVSNLSKIILVGGSTKSKHVREFVQKSFNTKVFCDIDPDLTVAYGAASLAHSISTKNSDSAILIDVTPLSLGIETKGGLMNKIIPRNANIPVSSAQEYITAEDNQDFVNIKIFQGERPLAKDNEFLGEFILSGFEKRPRGQTKIVVKFNIDASGLITVQAFDKETGLQAEVILSPLTTEKINQHMDSLELIDDSEKITVEHIELENLKEIAKTLMHIINNGHSYEKTYEEYESVQHNLVNLKIFIQSLEDELELINGLQ